MLDWITFYQEGNNFFFHYNDYDTDPINLLPNIAVQETISYIQQNYPAPYTLMLSGGVDSQAMLYAWILSKCPFNTFSGKYNNNFNKDDLQELGVFAKQFDITINYVDFDVLNFFQTDYIDYVNLYRCGSPHILTFIKMSEMIKEGTVIFSGNFCTQDGPGKPIVDQNNFALYRYSLETKKSLVPFFFAETRNLYYSFYSQERKLIHLKTFDINSPDDVYMNKVNIYQRHGFPVIPQRYKMTGFELIKDYYDQNFSHLVTVQDKLLRTYRQTSKRTFDLLLRNKFEHKFENDKYFYCKRKINA